MQHKLFASVALVAAVALGSLGLSSPAQAATATPHSIQIPHLVGGYHVNCWIDWFSPAVDNCNWTLQPGAVDSIYRKIDRYPNSSVAVIALVMAAACAFGSPAASAMCAAAGVLEGSYIIDQFRYADSVFPPHCIVIRTESFFGATAAVAVHVSDSNGCNRTVTWTH